MPVLKIEKNLKSGAHKEGKSFYSKYDVLKDRLFTNEYNYWASSFPGGNDHGPAHIERVLEKLDGLLGPNPLHKDKINIYELFLTMMAVLYHDVGILVQRKDHADFSAEFIEKEQNEYIFDERDREVIRAAVVSHSSSKDIEDQCAGFSGAEVIGEYTVRPRTIAALVRFADELDEDYRRADSIVGDRLKLPVESQFFWEFCQRISGIRPNQSAHEIVINVKFKNEDVGRIIQFDKQARPFLSLFAEKLTKINRERITVNRFLPDQLRYHRIIIAVKPLNNHDVWVKPREFYFTDRTTASDFVSDFPELLLESVNDKLILALESIHKDLEGATSQLKQLADIASDLPSFLQLRIYYYLAYVYSLQACNLRRESPKWVQTLDYGVEYFKKWLELGTSGVFRSVGQSAQNEIALMASNKDFQYLLKARSGDILKILGKDFQSLLLPKTLSDQTDIELADSKQTG